MASSAKQSTNKLTINPSVHPGESLKALYNHAMDGGKIVDTTFILFSRVKKKSGIVEGPRPVYASSTLLRHASPYFEGLLAGGFRESKSGSASIPESTNEYDYLSDSDLESDLDEEEAHNRSLDDAGDSTANLPKAHESPDSDPTAEPSDTTSSSSTIANRSDLGSKFTGRVIVIPDVAFTTWRALIYYLGTDDITFRSLKSTGNDRESNQATLTPPVCSPKSMYRLCDRLHIEPLRKKALDAIRAQLSPKNIFHEMFSPYTSRYPDVQEVEVLFAYTKRQELNGKEDIPYWLSRFAGGELGHAESSLRLLLLQALNLRAK
ncbi:hypothetical protein K474DRAFT_1663579 [Panus rudis PR-1116 ss-1]|nr:hypothetical protein K474DRAFT_1663579 [Panus rudis PR-1116 ss-1]